MDLTPISDIIQDGSIPVFDHRGLLPPFTGPTPTDRQLGSPYQTNPLQLVSMFCKSQCRLEILKGYILFRQHLHVLGFTDGVQWVDGSFMTDVERFEGRNPGDIDVVTFHNLPAGCSTSEEMTALVMENLDTLHPKNAKAKFNCDAYFLFLGSEDKYHLLDMVRYWSGLFSHRKSTFEWKGMLQIPLGIPDVDQEALDILQRAS